ncbi:MAG TPA: efflux RND transporter periplasmic adaptor subunit [Acidobacteriaceae bacterium]
MQVSKSSRSNTLALLFGIVIITVLGAVGLHYLLRDKVTVRVAQASYQDLLSTISTNGKVEPVQNFDAHSGPGGTVQKVLVQVGQKVHKGDLLVIMNSDEARAQIARANAELQAAQLGLQSVKTGGTRDEQINLSSDLLTAQNQAAQASRDLNATLKLQQNGAASAAEVNAARQRLLAAQNTQIALEQRKNERFTKLDHAHAQAALGEAQASLAAANASLKEVEIRAPFDGTIYSVSVHDYDYVAAGELLLSLADLSRLRVRAYFDEPEIGKLAEGQSVRLTWDAKPNLSWHGRITRVPDTVITYGTRTVGEVMISVEDADNQLLPNTNVNATVTTLARQHVLTVPREALHTERSATFVYVLNSHTLEKRAIQIGGVNLTQVEIVNGLKAGDDVALSISGIQPISNGLHVDTIQ